SLFPLGACEDFCQQLVADALTAEGRIDIDVPKHDPAIPELVRAGDKTDDLAVCHGDMGFVPLAPIAPQIVDHGRLLEGWNRGLDQRERARPDLDLEIGIGGEAGVDFGDARLVFGQARAADFDGHPKPSGPYFGVKASLTKPLAFPKSIWPV